RADYVILALGGCSTRDFGTAIDEHGAAIAGDASDMNCGEGIDVCQLALHGVQLQLAQAIRETGTPMVAALIEGRPHSLEWFADHCPALLTAWYPGIDGGIAVAEAIFGAINPSGRLAASIPRCDGQLPVNYNRYPRVPSDYCDGPDSPRYGFGYGLSYTRFELSDLTAGDISLDALTRGGRVEVELTAANRGERAGRAVVQLYVRDVRASVLRRVRELKAFDKIDLAPGESRRVQLSLGFDELALYDAQMRRRVEPGAFLLTATDGSGDAIETTVWVTP
ncbi:MAG: beta-glucosidase, partial [Clostridiales bacterium]|nr:beta-glucosidase [Clostridiales bacterium]